jgi:hypothetical protein
MRFDEIAKSGASFAGEENFSRLKYILLRQQSFIVIIQILGQLTRVPGYGSDC